jgi:hypothetical protein
MLLKNQTFHAIKPQQVRGFVSSGLLTIKVHFAYDGIVYGNRVDNTTYNKINAKVVDQVLNSRTFASRLLSMGKPFSGKTMDFPVKVVYANQGEFFTGLETLTSSATDTTVALSFAHTAFHQPAVSIMLESFANSGEQQAIDLDTFKMEEAIAEAVQSWGNAVYGTGTSNQPLGLEAIVDDGTNNSTIGGQSRSTYTSLKAQVQAFGSGILSLANLDTLYDATIASGLETEEPNLHLTTKSIWSLYGQLLSPQIRADYTYGGGVVLPLRGNEITRRADLGGQIGFTVLAYRARPLLRDDAAVSGKWYMLNERYFGWRGRTTVPSRYAAYLSKVDLGKNSTIDGVPASPDYAPPSNVGWFFQNYLMLPQQAGQIARLYGIGQMCGWSFRRQGKGTGITTL